MSEFDKTEVDIFIAQADTSPIRLNVNGHTTAIQVGVEATVAAGFLPALDDAGVKYRRKGDMSTQALSPPYAADSINPATQVPVPDNPANRLDENEVLAKVTGAEGNAGAAAFNAGAVVGGTLEQAVPQLADLTNEQLKSVSDAEKGRDAPRKGLLDAIDAEITKRNAA
jgi:hypothetical protein